MRSQKKPEIIRLEIAASNRRKRAEGLEILARLIARTIVADKLVQAGEQNSLDKNKRSW